MDDILNQLNSADSFFSQYEAKIMRLRNLLEITKIINSTLEEEKLAQTILFSCQGQFLVQNASVILLEDVDQGIYTDRLSIGLEKENFDLKISRNSQLVSLFTQIEDETQKPLLERKAHIVKDVFALLESVKEKADLELLSPEVLTPLWGKNSLYGFLFLGRKLDGSNFTAEDLSYIYQFADLAAISIENAKLFEMAIIDRMTRLYNHQFFKNSLYEESEKCKRAKNDLSLMFFDIDHFKNFNDTYGHQQGDIVLKEVARIIKESVRSSDLAARYGGEEFSVIMPKTNLDEAFKVAEKIRETIQNHEFPGQDEALHVTISIGIAQHVMDDELFSPTDFVEMADQALYYSKRNGRNKVTLYSQKVIDALKKQEEK